MIQKYRKLQSVCSTQCRKFILPFRFYVKSVLVILEAQKTAILIILDKQLQTVRKRKEYVKTEAISLITNTFP